MQAGWSPGRPDVITELQPGVLSQQGTEPRHSKAGSARGPRPGLWLGLASGSRPSSQEPTWSAPVPRVAGRRLMCGPEAPPAEAEEHQPPRVRTSGSWSLRGQVPQLPGKLWEQPRLESDPVPDTAGRQPTRRASQGHLRRSPRGPASRTERLCSRAAGSQAQELRLGTHPGQKGGWEFCERASLTISTTLQGGLVAPQTAQGTEAGDLLAHDDRAGSRGAGRTPKCSRRTEVRMQSSQWTDSCVQSRETSRSSHKSPQTGFRKTSKEIQEAQEKVVHK